MNVRKIERYTRGKGVSKVCRTPDFLLKARGRRCGKRTPDAADCFCNTLVSRCQTLENREIMKAAQLLLGVRSTGAERMAKISNEKDILAAIPAPYSLDTPQAIRANNHNAALRETQSQSIRRETELLCNDDILITSINSALNQRIRQMRNACRKKIGAFVMGVRMGGNSDYRFTPEFPDADVKSYINDYSKTDSSVHKMATETYYTNDKEGAK